MPLGRRVSSIFNKQCACGHICTEFFVPHLWGCLRHGTRHARLTSVAPHALYTCRHDALAKLCMEQAKQEFGSLFNGYESNRTVSADGWWAATARAGVGGWVGGQVFVRVLSRLRQQAVIRPSEGTAEYGCARPSTLPPPTAGHCARHGGRCGAHSGSQRQRCRRQRGGSGRRRHLTVPANSYSSNALHSLVVSSQRAALCLLRSQPRRVFSLTTTKLYIEEPPAECGGRGWSAIFALQTDESTKRCGWFCWHEGLLPGRQVKNIGMWQAQGPAAGRGGQQAGRQGGATRRLASCRHACCTCNTSAAGPAAQKLRHSGRFWFRGESPSFWGLERVRVTEPMTSCNDEVYISVLGGVDYGREAGTRS